MLLTYPSLHRSTPGSIPNGSGPDGCAIHIFCNQSQHEPNIVLWSERANESHYSYIYVSDEGSDEDE